MKIHALTHKGLLSAAALMLLTLIVVAASPAAGARNASADSWEKSARSRKADYFFLEALRLNATPGNAEDVYMLLRRAAELAPGDVQIGAELGFYETAISSVTADTAMRTRGIQRLKRKFEDAPEDFFWSSLYANQIRQPSTLREVVRVEHVLDSLYPEKTEVSLRYADDLGVLGAQGDTAALARSMAVLDRLQRSYGMEPWLVSRRVGILSSVKDTAGVFRTTREMLDEKSGSSDRNLLAGTVFAFYNRPDSAIFYMNRACELDSTNSNAIVQRAEYFKEIGDSASYDREVFNALELSTLDVELKTDMLTHYVRELYTDSTPAQQQRINDLFNVLLTQHPHEARIHYLYASYLALMHRMPEAAEQFRYTTDLEPTNHDAWRMLISACGQSEDYEGILSAAIRAREFFPDEYWWSIMEALAYSNLERDPEAIKALDEALANPSFDVLERSQLMGTKGDIFYKMENTDSAFVCYEKAIELDPTNINALNNAAYHLTESGGDLDKAETWSSYAVGMEPDNSTYLDTYAWVFFKKADYAKAKEYIDKALADEDTSGFTSEIYSHAGDIYFMCGDPDKALGFWKKALELDPDDSLLQRKVEHKTFYYK